tara:strand:+ start:2476 stop:2865 length:390 start_codon:yes stop_codon:yes gene_type:complete
MNIKTSLSILVAALSLAVASAAQALSINISWDPNPETDYVTSYVIYIDRTQDGADNYVELLTVPARSAGLPVLIDIDSGNVAIVVTAKNVAGLESLPSDRLWIPGVPGKPTGVKVLPQILVNGVIIKLP